MKSVGKIFLTPFALIALINLYSGAAMANENFYAGMSVGVSKTQAVQNNPLPIFSTLRPLSSNQTSAIHYKTGSNARLRLGYEQQNIRTELEALTFYSGYKNLKTNQVPVEFLSGRTKALSALLTVYYDAKHLNTDIFPFVGAGAGVAVIKNRLFLPDADIKRLDKKLACQGMAGLMFNVIPNMSLSMDYRYFITQRLKAFNKKLNNQSFNLGFLVRF